MAWPHLGGIIKVVVTYGFNGVPSVNVHFVLQRTPDTPVPNAELVLAANAFHTAWNTTWKTRAHEDWSVDSIIATDWSGIDGEAVGTSLTLPIDGVATTGDPSPASVTLVGSHRTGLTGKSRRGRNYIAGVAQAEVDGNSASQGLVTDVATLYSGLDTALDGEDMDLVVYSLMAEGAKRVTPLATIVTATIVNAAIDTQRRRLT